jgi:hypothetical protein
VSSDRAPFRRADPDRAADPDEAERQSRRAREQALQQLDDEVRQVIARRAVRSETTSRYDRVAEALLHVLGDQLLKALISPDFEVALRGLGFAVVPVAAEPPAAPEGWLYDALDLMGVGGQLVKPLAHMERLWAVAWRAGYEAAGTAEREGT